MSAIDPTCDPARRSWIESANGDGDFPIQNLPYGVVRRSERGGEFGIGVAIGDSVLDLGAAVRARLFPQWTQPLVDACLANRLNDLMGLGAREWHALRTALSDLLGSDAPEKVRRALGEACLFPIAECEHSLPAGIGNFSDFFSSIHHATNAGRLFRPDNPLFPNYRHVPIAYHGRASSIVLSGEAVIRPHGQTRAPNAAQPTFGPCRHLDYELELGFYVGPGNRLGTPIPIASAFSHVFGVSLLNDWSARDIQAWEYQPLGPFLGKSFATSVAPWVVSAIALSPFRIPRPERPAGDPQPLPYLDGDADRDSGGLDIRLEVSLATRRMRESGMPAVRLSTGSFASSYWTVGQMLAHHTSNGCNLVPGDLIGTGTISGATPDSWGSLLELTARGANPLQLPTGERRGFLGDGDEITIAGHCERPGFARIGLGECRAVIAPAFDSNEGSMT